MVQFYIEILMQTTTGLSKQVKLKGVLICCLLPLSKGTRTRHTFLAPGIDGSRFLPVLGKSIRNWCSRTLCNLTRGGPFIRFICGVTSVNLMVHYVSLMLKFKFTEFVILKNKYNCWCYISGLYLCSGVICEVNWFGNRSAGFFSNVNKWK